jgi:hypothetical protein
MTRQQGSRSRMPAVGLGLLAVATAFIAGWLQEPLYGDNCPFPKFCINNCACITCFVSATTGNYYNYIDGTCCRKLNACGSIGSYLPGLGPNRYQQASSDVLNCSPSATVDGQAGCEKIKGGDVTEVNNCGTTCVNVESSQ